MDQCTHEVRAEYWRKIIQACGQRPAGQSAKQWMDENGIREQSQKLEIEVILLMVMTVALIVLMAVRW